MKLIEVPWLTAAICRKNPCVTYVFGDNSERWGRGGQARIRGEPNAYGIVTKLAPYQYMSDEWLGEMQRVYEADLRALLARPIVAWPADGIGTGRAQLETRAPLVWAELGRLYEQLRSASE